jgi:hypothetical protein
MAVMGQGPAVIGVMKHEVMLDAGVVHCTRHVLCGYWSQPYSPYKRKDKIRYDNP